MEQDRRLVVAGTGHRNFGDDDLEQIVRDWLNNRISELQPTLIITGMALGFDTWLAKEALRQEIPFIAAVPFQDQDARWHKLRQTEYRNLLKQAQEVRVVSRGSYAAWKFQKRNEWMVDRADLVLAAWDGRPVGGTANCVAYAKRANVPLEYLPGLQPDPVGERDD